MRHNIVLVALSALTVANAQNNNNNNNNRNITINPNEVDLGLRSAWCTSQIDTCGILCFGQLKQNDCEPSTLEYSCLCANGSAPGLEYYKDTIPTFVCNQAEADCIVANTNSARAQEKCREEIGSQCGTLDRNNTERGSPSEDESSSSSTTRAPTATNSDSAAVSTSSSTDGAAPTNIAYIGSGAAMVAAGVFAALL